MLLTLFALPFLLQHAAGQEQTPTASQIGDKVCIEGFIMDVFCIERGTLLDAPSVRSLLNPEQHSVHCLADVGVCINSGYEVLLPPPRNNEFDNLYRRAFRLDNNGNNKVLTLARKTGSVEGDPDSFGCYTCTGEGDLTKGFRALVVGVISDIANGDIPPVVAVTHVLPASSECPNDRVVESALPSSVPSAYPSVQPLSHPSFQPLSHPSIQSSSYPSIQPSSYPSFQPSPQPSSTDPSSTDPSPPPSPQPSLNTSSDPLPSTIPSSQPTILFNSTTATAIPTPGLSLDPSSDSSSQPSFNPSLQSSSPSFNPSSESLLFEPSSHPSFGPTPESSSNPSLIQSLDPSSHPSPTPSSHPSSNPSLDPSPDTSSQPSSQPSQSPLSQPLRFVPVASERVSSSPTSSAFSIFVQTTTTSFLFGVFTMLIIY